MTTTELVKALRICFRDLDDGADCPNCPLYGNENCLAEVMGGAADLIEWLSGANAHLYEELKWKDRVIALAQRKQAEAEAERDALREKKRWIPVSEKAPEYDMPQLAMTADGEVLTANYAYGEWFDTWGQDVDVTHWMPLPEAPEDAL